MYGNRCGLQPKLRSNDFTASAQFVQPPGGVISSCIAGQTISPDVILSIKSNSPSRYAAGVFFGQNGNLPSLTTPPPANMCSLGLFPSSPAPFANLDGSPACGDFVSAEWRPYRFPKLRSPALQHRGQISCRFRMLLRGITKPRRFVLRITLRQRRMQSALKVVAVLWQA